MAKDGLVIIAQSGFPVQNPYLQILNKAHDQMMKLLVEFGMTPAARTKVNATSKDEDESDPWDEFIKKYPNKPIGKLSAHGK